MTLCACDGMLPRLAGQGFAHQGNHLIVSRTGNLQAALDAAQRGETIELEAGAVYRGRWILPVKAGEGWVTIQSSALDRLPPGDTRVKPEHAALMPKLVCKDCPAIDAAVTTISPLLPATRSIGRS